MKETSTDENIDLEISKYDVVERQYPSIEELRTIDAVIISGSFADSSIVDKSMWDLFKNVNFLTNLLVWVLRLCGFLIMLHDDFPHIRQIGICFVSIHQPFKVILFKQYTHKGNATSC